MVGDDSPLHPVSSSSHTMFGPTHVVVRMPIFDATARKTLLSLSLFYDAVSDAHVIFYTQNLPLDGIGRRGDFRDKYVATTPDVFD